MAEEVNPEEITGGRFKILYSNHCVGNKSVKCIGQSFLENVFFKAVTLLRAKQAAVEFRLQKVNKVVEAKNWIKVKSGS